MTTWEEGALSGGSDRQEKTPHIGKLAEGSLHRALKDYYCPNPDCQEQKIGPFVADIVTEEEIIEIQTGNFASLRQKLPFYASLGLPVRVVFPLRVKKCLIWQNPQGNFLSKSSGKREHLFSFFAQLWQTWKQIDLSAVRFDILSVSVTEMRVRYENRGYGKRKRTDSLLEEVLDCRTVWGAEGLRSLLPSDLQRPFCVADLKKAAACTTALAQKTCLVLRSLGVIGQVGKKGNAYLYDFTESNNAVQINEK